MTAGSALRSAGLDPAEREELAAVVTGEAPRLARLVDKLLDLSRLQGGTAEPREDWCSIEEVVEAAVADLEGPDGPPVRLALDRDLPLVRADAAQLERAFFNLLENARRYSGDAPVQVRARVSGGRLLVRVVDRGPGHPARAPRADLRALLPRRRRRARIPARGSGWRSSGASWRPTAAACGRSRCPARGRRSWSSCRCPRRRRSRRRDPAGRARRERGPARRRVLVCDDELQILRALKVVLREAGFEVEAVATGQEALDAAAVRPPDAAIVDLMLPDGDGVEVCRQLREWSAMPILVLSALGDEDQKVRALEAGADDYVTKPFGPRELVARLRAVLRRAGARADDEPLIAVDGLEIDLAAHVVRRDGRRSTSRRSSTGCCGCWRSTAGAC